MNSIDLLAAREEIEMLANAYHRGCLKTLADLISDHLRRENPDQDEAERLRQAHIEIMEEIAYYDEELNIQ